MDLEKRPITPASINNSQGVSAALAAENNAEVDLQSVYVDVEVKKKKKIRHIV